MATFRIREAASLLGVSTDTLRRWADEGRIETVTDASGRLAVEGVALARLAQELAEPPGHGAGQTVVAHSARNRFSGLITRVVRDTVMAQVEIQAGPYRLVSLLSREAADELGLEPGMLAVAAVKSTNVSVEIPGPGPTRSSRPPHHLAVLSTPMPLQRDRTGTGRSCRSSIRSRQVSRKAARPVTRTPHDGPPLPIVCRTRAPPRATASAWARTTSNCEITF